MSNIENIQRDLDQIKKTYQQKFLHWTDEFVMSNSKERLYGYVAEKLNKEEIEQHEEDVIHYVRSWGKKPKTHDELDIQHELDIVALEMTSGGDIEYSTPPGHAWDFVINDEQIKHKDYPQDSFCDCPACNSDVVPKKIKIETPDKINWGDIPPKNIIVKKPKTIEHNSFCDCPSCLLVKEQKTVKEQAIVQIEQLDIRPGDRLLITINPRPNGQNYSASSILKINKELANWAGVPVKLIYADVINKITIIRDEDDSDEWCPDRD